MGKRSKLTTTKKILNDYFSKMIILFVIVSINVFTIACLKIFIVVGSEPTILIGAYFAFMSGEVWALALLKKAKRKGETNEGTYNDELG